MELKLKNISKSYGKREILNNINLEINNGIYGLLGANGVGKSTLFNIISGYMSSDKGKIIYPKVDSKKEVLLSVLPQNFCGYPEMTILEFLEYIAMIKGGWDKKDIKREIKEKIEIFHLQSKAKNKLKTLSGGQLRRVGLAQAFLLNPRIILLDEPTTGLDPKERIQLKNYISQQRKKQIIFISTHIVPDLEDITDEIFILKNGNFVEEGEESVLLQKLHNRVWEINAKDINLCQNNEPDIIIVKEYQKEGEEKLRIISEQLFNIQKRNMSPTLEDLYLLHFSGGSYDKI